MFKLDFGQVLEHAEPVFVELSDEAGDVEVGVDSVREREVIGLSQNFNAMRERSLATDCLLESS